MKRKLLLTFLIILFCIIPLIFSIQTYARYAKITKTTHYITTPEFYFSTNASDINIAYSNLDYSINIYNFLGSKYSTTDINYELSISDGTGPSDNYEFEINGNKLDDSDTYTSTIKGNQKNTEILNIKFNRITDNPPPTEILYFTIKSTYPFFKSYTYTVNIIAPAGFNVLGNPTEWTNKDATLTIVPDEGTKVVEYSFDNGETWQTTPSKTFSENQDVSIKIKDETGNISSAIIPITKIDKVAPQITPIEAIKDSSLLENPLTATLDDPSYGTDLATATDNLSGINEYSIEIYKNGDTPTKIESTNYFTKVGWYRIYLQATDRAGNKTTYETSVLVRWPKAGKYIVKRQGYVGEGISNLDTGSGLWKDTLDTGYDESLPYSSKYYYSGKEVNNYLNFSNTTFQILNIADNDTIKLISPLSGNSYGYEAWYSKLYKTSFYKSWANDWTPNNRIYDEDDKNKISVDFTSENSHIDEATYYAGVMERNEKYSILDVIKEERTNDKKIHGGTAPYFTGKVALPTVSDYIKANGTLDTIYNIRLTQTHSEVFKANNWLGSDVEQFTMTGEPGAISNDFWVLYPNVANEILSRTGYYNQKVRAVIYLKNNTILSGTGTEEDPFVVEENWDWFDKEQILE